jgi:radical SAM superfamily enzyme YgiQ (UPF0313 family)
VRVAIVVPPFDYGRMLYGLMRARAFHNAVPLGAVSVAAALREAGHDVAVIDAPAEHIDASALMARLREFQPESVGISSTSVIWRSAASLASRVKLGLGVPVFVGGPHPSLFPEHVMQVEAVDAAVSGEGEETAVELVAALESGRSLRGIPGVTFREHGRLVTNEARATSRELDEMPLPAYDLLDLSLYSAPPMRVRNMPALYMELFRGCAYARCSYCTSAWGLKNRYRRHSPRVAAQKVALLNSRFGAREIAFVDDDFVVGKTWIHDFCAQLRDLGNPVTWTCYVRASQVDESVFSAMASAGCHQVLIGMEVLDDRLLDGLNKDLTVESCGRAVRAAHAAGISVIGLFMAGVPGTTPESVDGSVERALEHGTDVAVFSLYRPLPGTPTFDQLGWGPDEYVDCFQLQKQAVFVPEAYRDRRHVEETFRHAYIAFYLDPRFMRRAIRRCLQDRVLMRQAMLGALTLADQFRPAWMGSRPAT